MPATKTPRKAPDETWVRAPVPDEVHEALTIMAVRRRISLQELLRQVLAQVVAEAR